MRESKITACVVVVLLVLLGIYAFVVQVRATEVAVHYRPPGKVLKVINAGAEDESGLYFRLPWPIDKVVKYDRRIRVLDGPLPQTQLKDDWQVIISVYVGWRIADPVAFQASLEGNVAEAANRLREIIFNEASKAVAKLTFKDLVSVDEKKLKFDEMEAAIMEGVKTATEQKGYGVEIVTLGVRRIAIPEATTEQVFKRMEAERQAVAEHYRGAGRSEMATIIARAETEAQRILADAEYDAKLIRSEGEAEEARHYDIFAQEPQLAILLRRLESLRTVARRAKEAGSPITFVLDTRTEPFVVFYRGPQESDEIRTEPAVASGSAPTPPGEQGGD